MLIRNQQYPLWATPLRRRQLVQMFLHSEGGACIFGHGQDCPELEKHIYEVFSEWVIDDWKADDRLERSIAWEKEKRRMHAAPLKKLWKRGKFDAIARDLYLSNRPTFRVLAIGIHAFSQQRVAKVEIPALEKTIWVNISGVKLSKNKLRKLFRHQKGYLPEEVYEIIQQRIRGYLSG